ncbi:hypothetical protein [Qipengyuania sediminis]|uniref:hypothetical protein n=1 Tax=Qipengyuania sediminis TaxID=1532023 RepID=UPI001F0FF2F2|nr:hypothetical protein [Qipengyuania sediminis]
MRRANITVRSFRLSATAAALAALAGCAKAPPPPPPPPPPAPVEVVPFRPIPPMGAAYVMDVPQLGPDGRRMTVLANMSEDERTWYFRSAWNVAALNCVGPAYQPILDGYAAFIKSHARSLRGVNSRIDASYRKQYPVAREAIKAREKTMTTVYNYFALPPARAAFCQSALEIANRALAQPKYDPAAFAAENYRALEVPFETFFTAYEQYQRDAAAWDAQYGARYGASQPGYVAVQAAARRQAAVPQAGVSDPTQTTAAKVTETGVVIDQTTGAEIPVIPVTPAQTSVPVVQPVPKDPTKPGG